MFAKKECPCCLETENWIDSPDPKRSGWIQTHCKCGRWLGYRPEREIPIPKQEQESKVDPDMFSLEEGDSMEIA
jgi:hypothetical protein